MYWDSYALKHGVKYSIDRCSNVVIMSCAPVEGLRICADWVIVFTGERNA